MPDIRATIVHISDLHFGGGINRGLLPQLKSLIEGRSPHFLVVSGDLNENPSPFSMKEACEWIEGVAKDCRLDPEHVLVIPGNHDYKIRGNIGLRRLTRVPFEVYFRRRAETKRRKERWLSYARLFLNGLWPWGGALKDSVEIREDKERAVLLFGFNSNPLFEMFATGKVSEEQIFEVVDRLQTAGESWEHFFKIAVVHHHPVPIAYVNTGLKERVQESFMVFYNAGTFLRELGHFGVDLILHGHKHYAGYTQLIYNLPDGLKNNIGILAAGAAAHGDLSDPMGNEFNVITIFDDDTVNIEQWYYAADVVRKEESKNFYFCKLDDVREQRKARALRRYGLRVRELTKTNVIDVKGYTTIKLHLAGCNAVGQKSLSSYEFHHPAFAPAYIRRFKVHREPNAPVFLREVIDKQHSGLRRVAGTLEFNEVRRAADGPFNLSYSFREMNSSALNFKEFQRKYSRKLDWEYGSVECKYPVETFTLRVEFPSFTEDEVKRLHADADAMALYLPSPKPYSFHREADLKPHEEETSRVRSQVKCVGRALELEVTAPIPEFVYRIRWRYQTPPEYRPDPIQEEKLKSIRANLIALAESVAEGGPPPPLYQRLTDMLDGLVETIEDRYERIDPSDPDEKLDVSLAVFDDNTSTLRFVAASFGSMAELTKEEFSPGEGCAGYSFEKGEAIVYHDNYDNVDYYIRPEEFMKERECAGGPQCTGLILHKTLLTIPWIESGIAVGVFSVGSTSQASRLLRLLEIIWPGGDNERKKKETEWLKSLTNTVGGYIVSQDFWVPQRSKSDENTGALSGNGELRRGGVEDRRGDHQPGERDQALQQAGEPGGGRPSQADSGGEQPG